MQYTARYITDDIKLSSYGERFSKSDIHFDQHMLVWFISGETRIVQNDGSHVFGTGDLFLIPRNQLATIINYPKDGELHKTVVMHLTLQRLRDYYADKNIPPINPIAPKLMSFRDHPLLQSCMASLIPYFDMTEVPEEIARMKIAEAISILRTLDPGIDNLLANFEEPDKIDLADYMEKNFMFNQPLERFSYLTGRSLSTFKRDFRKIFNETPQRWLTRKRLELAYYQLAEKKMKPIDACYESGFENLSHFSFAFKKQYGVAPSMLSGKA